MSGMILMNAMSVCCFPFMKSWFYFIIVSMRLLSAVCRIVTDFLRRVIATQAQPEDSTSRSVRKISCTSHRCDACFKGPVVCPFHCQNTHEDIHQQAFTCHFHCICPCAGQLLLSLVQKPEICQHTTTQQNVSIPVTIAALFAPSKPANTYTVVRKNQHIRNQHIPKQSCVKKVQSKETIMQQ